MHQSTLCNEYKRFGRECWRIHKTNLVGHVILMLYIFKFFQYILSNYVYIYICYNVLSYVLNVPICMHACIHIHNDDIDQFSGCDIISKNILAALRLRLLCLCDFLCVYAFLCMTHNNRQITHIFRLIEMVENGVTSRWNDSCLLVSIVVSSHIHCWTARWNINK